MAPVRYITWPTVGRAAGVMQCRWWRRRHTGDGGGYRSDCVGCDSCASRRPSRSRRRYSGTSRAGGPSPGAPSARGCRGSAADRCDTRHCRPGRWAGTRRRCSDPPCPSSRWATSGPSRPRRRPTCGRCGCDVRAHRRRAPRSPVTHFRRSTRRFRSFAAAPRPRCRRHPGTAGRRRCAPWTPRAVSCRRASRTTSTATSGAGWGWRCAGRGCASTGRRRCSRARSTCASASGARSGSASSRRSGSGRSCRTAGTCAGCPCSIARPGRRWCHFRRCTRRSRRTCRRTRTARRRESRCSTCPPDGTPSFRCSRRGRCRWSSLQCLPPCGSRPLAAWRSRRFGRHSQR